ncbi:tryptophan--tRNA ligase [Dokdonella koreensis]|uniref:Tryptophan--tRNA ligase n=1 Tax=Dokdonella koreensis DS-123 TaxID=1300342 RepID=A0A160DV56_9GAMM|nr:tryptophan--tRNA ligase [Dokdonella koreensis]ANB18407.1 Tryptophanyl-tRNA ligase [Dokdonella koreensis DS-123]
MGTGRRVLTGITTSGTPHLGNYVGAIRPAIDASRQDAVESFFFLADYHALIKCDDPQRVRRSRLEIAATWLACGLDADRVVFYRQSDIREIPELTWLLTCVTAKGLLNRAHAYKAAVDQNLAGGEDADAGVTAGLYMYPVLMAADILAFNAHRVPVGRDQIQHIEMARDIAQRFNHLHGAAYRAASGSDREPFVLPEAVIDESVATLPGLDGRKMSKSYDNTIPLFEGGVRHLRESIARIVTDSRAPGEPKNPDGSHLFAIYRAFASAGEAQALHAALTGGLAWGEAKRILFERVESEIAPMRERYDTLIARPDTLEDILRHGADKARAVAAPFVAHLRDAVGLSDFRLAATTPGKAPPVARTPEAGGGEDTPVPLGIKGPAAQDFSLTIAYSRRGQFLTGDLGGKPAAIALRRRIDALEGLDTVAATRADGLSELRLTLDGETIATGPAIAPAEVEAERGKVAEAIRLRREA